MQIFEHVASLQKFLDSCRKDSQKITLVPTMGGLHDGHMSLINRAQELSNVVVVSIMLTLLSFQQVKTLKPILKLLHRTRNL